MKNIKLSTLKGGYFCLLYFFLSINSSVGQSFFSAEVLSSSPNYGSVKTKLIPEEIVDLIQKQDFRFDQWSAFFHIKTSPNTLPVLGQYKIVDGQVVFFPKSLPDPALRYYVTFSYPELAKTLGSSLEEQAVFSDAVSFDPSKTTRPEIVSVTPDLDIVPANLLRFYIYFSAPMGLQNPYDFISIEDKDGRALVDAFVVIPEGLWNIDRTRLTLLLNPGKIEQGVNSNTIESDVLKAGNVYTLKIDNSWKGASGETLKSPFARTINASNPLRKAMNVNLWALKAEQNQIGILTIVTDHPLDQPLAKRMLYIRSKEGKILPSQVEFTSPQKLRVLWRPDGSTELELHIDHRLEDVSGNTPLNAFDLADGTRTQPTDEIKLNFKID